MKLRRAIGLLLGPAIASAMLVPLATAAEAAGGAPGLAICAIAGTVGVTPGVGEIPPGAPASGATYNFRNVAVVCAGTVSGLAAGVTDNGTFGPACGGSPEPPVLGQFCDAVGTFPQYQANGFAGGAVNGNLNCHGTVGGPILAPVSTAWAAVAGGTPTGGTPPGRWSLTAGALIEGNITMSCSPFATSPVTAGRMLNGNGIISLVAEPDPTTANTAAGVSLGTCPSTGPLSLPVIGTLPVGPQAWFCGIIVEGVSVVVDTTVN